MKMQKDHYEELARLLDEVKESNSVPFGQVQQAYRSAQLSDKRFRWDMLWAVPRQKRSDWFNKVYLYLNDDHIDTALRNYVKRTKE